MRPLEKLATIRAKLGSTIVFAVGLTLVLVFVFLGVALRSAFREAELGRLARVADQAATSEVLPTAPEGVTLVLLRDGVFTWYGPPVTAPPKFSDGRVHIGITGGLEYAAVPVQGAGQPAGMMYAVRAAPGMVAATVQFLRDFWWQLA